VTQLTEVRALVAEGDHDRVILGERPTPSVVV